MNTTTDPTSSAILVLAATGKTGRRVAAGLSGAGRAVRPASRSSATHFDWDDADTWAPALAGASAVYLVPPDPGPDLTPFVAAVEAAGVDHVVLLSARAPGQSGDDFLPRVEAAVTSSSLSWTILRPAWFAQNFTEGVFVDGLASGTLALPVSDGKEPFIDADDIAAVAVASFLDPGRHAGRVYELSGPELLTFADAVDVVAAASGRDLSFADVDPAAWDEEMRVHLPPPVVDILSHLLAAIRAGENAHLSDGVEQALGRPPTTFTDWATRTFGPS